MAAFQVHVRSKPPSFGSTRETADVESLEPLPFGCEVDLVAQLHDAEVVLRGRAQCSTGTQFGPLGARETHAILEAAESGGVAWEAYRRVA